MKDKILNEVEFELLKEFQKHLPGAIIAGGSVRDMHFGLPFSDVDIFYDMVSMPIAYIYDEIIPRIFGYTVEDKFWRVNNSAFQRSDTVYGEDTRDIVELEKYKGSRYQFIAVHGDPVRHVHKFDLNCCKIFYDGEKIHQTGDFKDFWKTKELNVTEAYKKSKLMGMGRLDKRVEKILFRYKKFDIKVSDFLASFLEEQKKTREEMNKKSDAKWKSVKLKFDAQDTLMQQVDAAAVNSIPQPGTWVPQGSIPVGVQMFFAGTTATTGNPLAPSAAAQTNPSSFADVLYEPLVATYNAAYNYGQGELIQLEPVPEPTEQA